MDESRPIFLTRNNETVIVLDKNVIKNKMKYRWSFVVTTKEYAIGYSYALLRANDPPERGTCYFVDKAGQALVDAFLFRCHGWMDDDQPIHYEVQLPKEGNSSIPLYRGLEPNVSISFPLGDPEKEYRLNLTILVVDGLGAAAKLRDVLEVSPRSAFRWVFIGQTNQTINLTVKTIDLQHVGNLSILRFLTAANTCQVKGFV